MKSLLPGLALLLVLLPGSGPAATLDDLYSTTVPVAGRGAAAQTAAIRSAMRDVLARATGRRDAGDLESLAPMVQGAERYVRSFQSASGGRLAVSFDGPAIEAAIDRSGLPYWGAERPLTLVWLLVERPGWRGLVSSATALEERRQVEAAAAQRGLPLVWPSPADDLRGALDAVADNQPGPLFAAARRYGAEGVLVGRSGPSGTRWAYEGPGGSWRGDGDLADGVHAAADRLAATYASRSAGQRSELLVTVTGIDSLGRFAAAQRALERAEAVRGVTVGAVSPGEAVFRVTVRGDAGALLAALRRDGRLEVLDGAGLVLELRP